VRTPENYFIPGLGSATVSAIALREEHMCVMTSDRTAWCAGFDYGSQVSGNGVGSGDYLEWTQVPNFP
jgi:hypothetical protein